MALRDKFGQLAALKPAKSRVSIAVPVSADPHRAVVPHSRGFSPALPEGATQLVEMLEGRVLSNSFGEHMAVQKWFSEPIGFPAPDGELNASALRLLAPGAESDVADPRQWLFLDT